jgi:hypothetical protein
MRKSVVVFETDGWLIVLFRHIEEAVKSRRLCESGQLRGHLVMKSRS